MRLQSTSPPRPGFTMIDLLVVILVSTVLVAILLVAIRNVREANVRTTSTDNLKNIVLAMHAYHDVNKFLPYCSTTPLKANTPTGGSAHFQLLPHLDQKAAYQAGTADQAFPAYLCPGRARPTNVCWTDYFYNLYLNANDSELLATNSKRTLVSISAGSSNTIGFGHGTIATSNWSASAAFNGSGSIFATPSAAGFETFRGGVAGMPKRDGDEGETVTGWGGPFPQGALMGMCDATVRVFPYTPLRGNFNTYLLPTRGEIVIPPDT